MRSRSDWESEINNALTAYSLTMSTSALAEWKVWRDLVITIAMILERITLIFKQEVQTYVKQEQHGGLHWYAQISLDFQNGDSLAINNGVLEYPTIDPTHRIITKVSVKEVLDDVLVVKVAKTSGASLAKLSTTEFNNYTAYMQQRKIPGTKVNVQTNDADVVDYDVEVYFDPLYPPSVVTQNILDALDAFKLNFAFDAILYNSALVDTFMSAQGVKGLGVTIFTVHTGGNVIVLNSFTELVAGYFNYGTTNINLIPA